MRREKSDQEEYELQELPDESVNSTMRARLARLQKSWRSQETVLAFPMNFWKSKVIIPKENRNYRIWVYVILAWAVYSSFFTPIEFGFFRGLPKHLWWIDQLVQIMFMVDIIVNFFVAYKDRHTYNWVTDYHSISLRYAKSDLLPDILACLPWDAIYKGSGEKEIIRYFLWIRLYRARKVDAFFRRLEQNIRVNYLFTRIVKLITVELYCTHTGACIFYYLATTLPASKEDFTWIGSLSLGGYTFHDFREIDLGKRYVLSLYFAIVTMTTVGYGDIHAVNTREMIFVMIFVSFDMILGAYLIGNMTALIVKGSNTEKFRDKMTALIKYMNRNRLDRDIRSQLKSHVQLQYESQFVEDGVVQDLPLSIRAKVAQSLYLSIVERVLLFQHCSTEFVNQIGMRVHEEYFLPGEVIMEQGSAVDQIYIVANGSLEEVVINVDGSEEMITSLEVESVFGEVAILCSIPQPYTIRVCNLCRVLRIDKQAIFNIMHIYFADGRQVLNNLLKYKTDIRLNLKTDISFLIAEQEVELSLKVNNAAYHGKTAHLKTLIKSGADPKRPDYDGRAPLHLAAGKGHEDIVSFLVQEGAEVDIEDKFGFTPLIEAVKGGHTKVIKILRRAGARLTSKNAGELFRKAVLNGNSELVEIMLENGMDPNSSDHNGRTGLHIAASEGFAMMARVLLENGANVDAKDRWGKTPVYESTQYGAKVFKNIFQDAILKKEEYLLEDKEASYTEGLAVEESIQEIDFDFPEGERLLEGSGKNRSRKDKQTPTYQVHEKIDSAKARRRCTIFSCPPWTTPNERTRGVVVWVPETIGDLLSIASQHFDQACNHVLNEDVGEILDMEFIRDSERIYIVDKL